MADRKRWGELSLSDLDQHPVWAIEPGEMVPERLVRATTITTAPDWSDQLLIAARFTLTSGRSFPAAVTARFDDGDLYVEGVSLLEPGWFWFQVLDVEASWDAADRLSSLLGEEPGRIFPMEFVAELSVGGEIQKAYGIMNLP